MPNKNLVILQGHLGDAPEVRYLSNDDPVANFSIATSTNWKDKNGEWQESIEWHRCVAWKHFAEFAGTLQKGDGVYVEGRLKTRKWQDHNGQDRYTTEVHGSVYKLDYPRKSQAKQPPSRQTPQQPTDDFDDDIPF